MRAFIFFQTERLYAEKGTHITTLYVVVVQDCCYRSSRRSWEKYKTQVGCVRWASRRGERAEPPRETSNSSANRDINNGIYIFCRKI